jgi:hypothetical protein
MSVANPIGRDTLGEMALGKAVRIRTDRPAQGMMHSVSVLHLAAQTPCFRGIPCKTFDAWAPYMVEMTPREQWTSFAPYYAPNGPALPMQHYINVVTDTASAHNITTETGSPFPFTGKIEGTDIVWGTMPVDPGTTHYLVGTAGARFGGSVYGLMKGGELYRPGRTRKGNGAGIASGDGGTNVLHPCEYEEYTALSYGYPLAPRRAVLRTDGTIQVDSVRQCMELTLHITMPGGSTAGLRSVTLDPGPASNAKIVAVSPTQLFDLPGMTDATVTLVPIDPAKPASAIVRIEDRAGRTILLPYSASASMVSLSGNGGSSVDFGKRFYTITTDTTLVYTNTAGRDITISGVSLATPNGAYRIVSTSPSGPAELPARSVVLKNGERLEVTITVAPTSEHRSLANAVVVTGDCASIQTQLSGTLATSPVILTYDVDFGVMRRGDPMVLRDMKICNIGAGSVSFDALDSAVVWGDGRFSIGKTALRGLRSTVLGVGECTTVKVGFNPIAEGIFVTTAHMSSSTQSLRDSSVWRAIVTAGSGVEEAGHPGYAFAGMAPNPAGGNMAITYRLGAPGRTTIAIYGLAGRLVAKLADGPLPAGEGRIEWDATGLPAGVYYCRITSGEWSATRPLVVVR